VFKRIFLVRRSQLKDALKNRQLGRHLLEEHHLSGGASGTPCQSSSPKSMDMTFTFSRKITHLQTFTTWKADEI
jgi:hypothetical protein